MDGDMYTGHLNDRLSCTITRKPQKIVKKCIHSFFMSCPCFVVHVSMYVHMYMYQCMYTCTCINVHVCTHVHVSMYVHMYIHVTSTIFF